MRAAAAAAAAAAASAAAAAAPWQRARCGPVDLVTPFGAALDPASVLREHPNPLLVRGPADPDAPGAQFATLHGVWQFEHTTNASAEAPPFGRNLAGSILVPFAPESCLSGVGYLTGAPPTPDFRTLWYRLLLDNPLAAAAPAGASFLLHFEAVDWNATVYLNGALLGSHVGGYSAFSFDVTALIRPAANELLVFAHDPTEFGAQPQGKQLIASEKKCGTGGNKYVPASGIWSAVWLEAAPGAARIDDVQLRTNATSVRLSVTAVPPGGFGADATLNVTISLRGSLVRTLSVPFTSSAPVDVAVPGAETWSAATPTLYDAVVTVAGSGSGGDGGVASDSISTYFGLRSVGLETYVRPEVPALGPLFNYSLGGVAVLPGSPFALPPGAAWDACAAACLANATNCTGWIYTEANCGGGPAAPTCTLKGQAGLPLVPQQACTTAGKAAVPAGPAARPTINGEPAFFAAWLDQSYWPDGIFTAPSDAALASDLAAAKRFGLNAVRMHTKMNPRRWYHHADILGLFILQDFVQKFLREGVPSDAAATVPLFLADADALIDQRGSHPSIVQWDIFNEGDCVGLFDVPSVVDWTEGRDGLTSAHGLLGMGRLVDTNSGGPGDALALADVHDVHTCGTPRDTPEAVRHISRRSHLPSHALFFPGALPYAAGTRGQPRRCQAPPNTLWSGSGAASGGILRSSGVGRAAATTDRTIRRRRRTRTCLP